jgi:2-phosphosulfolactate phosphatase
VEIYRVKLPPTFFLLLFCHFTNSVNMIFSPWRCHVPRYLYERNLPTILGLVKPWGEVVSVRVRVDLLPKPPYRDTVVLIDVLRTCTAGAMLFGRGLERLEIIDSLKLARQRAESTGATLLGERAGLPPEGFNYGSSLAEIRAVTVNSHAILTSENAPKALSFITGAETIFLGSLYNADAVARAALQHSKGEVFLVCSGFLGQEDLDDTLTAGYLAARLKTLMPTATLEGASAFAIALMKAFPDPLEAFWRSSTGHYLRGLNMVEDLAIASYVSQSDCVPVLESSEQTEQGNIFSFVKAGKADGEKGEREQGEKSF